VDRWNSDSEFLLKVNLFPEKVPKTFHNCSTKVISFIFPPAVMENSEKRYTGLEVILVELIFKKLNLTAEYNVSPNTRYAYFPLFKDSIQQLESASSDIAIGVLPFHASIIDIADATIPYLYIRVSWYVPCPNPVSRWKSIYKIFGSQLWACFSAVAILGVIVMWLLAKYETQLHVRQSENYKTIIYCIYNLCAVFTGVSVPLKPISLSLRIFFTAWVWYSFAITTVYQTYFFGLLLNPGFEERITTMKELMESGLEYGYPGDIDGIEFFDPTYNVIRKNRKICKTVYKCLQRVVERKDFATIFDSFHAEYFRTKLLFHNIEVSVCTLQEDILLFMVSMYMAKGNPLLHRFNKIITRIFESGVYGKWQDDLLYSSRLDDHPIDDDDINFSDFATNELKTDYSAFSLNQLRVVFEALLIGQIINTFVFLVEVLYYRACITAATGTAFYRTQRDK
jgi:ABC-type amino acid transport substrate-binding protein